MSPAEWWATGLSIVYIFLAISNKKSCFIFGFASSLIWAYATYVYYNLVWDGTLNIFYAIMSVYGWITWNKIDTQGSSKILTLSNTSHLVIFFLMLVLTLIFSITGTYYFDAAFAIWDALTTSMLMIGTLLLSKRYYSSWLYLLVADLIYIFIYYQSGATLFMLMMVVYSILAIIGWYKWRQLLPSSQSLN